MVDKVKQKRSSANCFRTIKNKTRFLLSECSGDAQFGKDAKVGKFSVGFHQMDKGNTTEDRIIQASLALFVSKGYHGTSIRDITGKIGLTKGALYAHFESKRSLLLRIIEKYSTEYIDKMIQAIREHRGDALSKLHFAITYSSRYAITNPNLTLFLTFIATELYADHDFQSQLQEVYEKYQHIIRELIVKGIRQGIFKTTLDPDMVAFTYVALHDGVFQQWTINRDSLDGKEFVKTFRAILMRGIMK